MLKFFLFIELSSVAEPPFFCAVPVLDGLGPGAESDSCSDLLGLALAPTYLGWLRLQVKKDGSSSIH